MRRRTTSKPKPPITTKKKAKSKPKAKPRARTKWVYPLGMEIVAADWQQQRSDGRWRPVGKSQIGHRIGTGGPTCYRRPAQPQTMPLTQAPQSTGNWVTPSYGDHVALTWEFRRDPKDTWKPASQSALIGMGIGRPGVRFGYEFRKPGPLPASPLRDQTWELSNGDPVQISTMNLVHIGSAIRCCINQRPDSPLRLERMQSLIGLIFEYCRRRGTEPEILRALITGAKLLPTDRF